MTGETREKNYVSFVVCVADEGSGAVAFIEELYAYACVRFEDFEIIAVNNAASGGVTAEIKAGEFFASGRVVCLNLAWRHSLELAMMAGADMAIGDFVYEIEVASRDWPLETLTAMYERCLAGSDIVAAVAVRPVSMDARLFYWLLNRISYLRMELTTEEVRLVSRRALNAVLSAKETVRYRKALYHACGFPYSLLEYKPEGGRPRRAQNGLFDRVGLAFDVLISFSNIGFRLAIGLSAIFFLMSVAIGMYAIGSYVFRSHIASGWTTMVLFLSIGFCGLFLILGLLGKYLSIVLAEVQSRPPYRVVSADRAARG